jgi:hypothetical protein
MLTTPFAAPHLRSHSAPLRHPGAEPSQYTTEAVLTRRKEERKGKKKEGKEGKDGIASKILRAMGCGKPHAEKEGEGKGCRVVGKEGRTRATL